jgi:hypothetical protein
MYSRLAFTEPADRSVAVLGLEKRLLRTFRTSGGYGILESFPGQSLLWQRADDNVLIRIEYPPNRDVPSWSWMAYHGGVTYMKLPLRQVKWRYNMAFKPKTSDGSKWGKEIDESEGLMVIKAQARRLKIDRNEMLQRIIFDENSNADITSKALRCVIIGIEDLGDSNNPDLPAIRFVLIVKPSLTAEAPKTYERAGAGWLMPQDMSMERGPWILIR